MSHSYRELIAWQKAKRLAVHIYECTDVFPKSETYGLTAQTRHFRGSLLELQTQLEIASDLKLIRDMQCESLIQECYQVLGLLNRLIESLREITRPPRGVSSLETSKRETLKR